MIRVKRLLSRALLVVVAVVMTITSPLSVFALPENLIPFYSGNDLQFYDPEDTGCAASSVSSTISLTTEQKIAATMIVGFVASDREAMKAAVAKYQLGGVFINGKPDSTMNKEFFASINSGLQSPLLVAADDEGGKVIRFQKNAFSFTLPTAETMGGWSNEDMKIGSRLLASNLKIQGVNMVLAPVVDLDSNNTSNAISAYDRAFSGNPDVITEKAGVFMDAMSAYSIGTSLKHFPGLAKTTQNTDAVYQKINADIGAFGEDLKPFANLMNHENTTVMLSNTVITGWGSDPTSINAKAVEYLRQNMDYNGVIITDDLGVFAKYSTNPIPIKDAVRKAYTAGVTMPLFMYPGDTNMDEVIKEVKATVPQTTIDAAYAAVSSYKSALGLQSTNTSTAITTTGNNKDYRDRTILTDDQLNKINANKSFYEKAATQVGIPWPMIAVIHLRENSLARTNPANGQGIYQFVNKNGGPYPTGPVTDDEFQRQTILAAEFIKSKSSRPELLAKGDVAEVKDTFFGYNGRSALYIKQATQLGFSEGYEGSPYVMNIADKIRDPEFNTTTWGQIKTDHGGLSYPTNGDYGAFITYAALGNVTLIPSSPLCGGQGTAGGGSAGANGWDLSGVNAMTIYYQCGSPWGNQTYGIGIICKCGCGPTSMAMATASLKKDTSITPKVMADFFASHGGQIGGDKCGSTWALYNSSSALATQYSINFTDLGTDASKFPDAIRRGSFILMSQGEGIFTSGGHFLLIRGVTSTGNFLVADPASKLRTENQTGYTTYQIVGNGQPDPTRQRGFLKNAWEVSLK